jgi:hypothetical protein
MPTRNDDALLRAAFGPARELEPDATDVAAVLTRAGRSHPRAGVGRHLVAPALVAVALLAGAAYAVPTTRAALDDVTASVAGVFEGWAEGGAGRAPGRPLAPGERAPLYFDDGSWARDHVREPRVIAAAGGYKLYAFRERNGRIGFDLGDTGVAAAGFTAADFRRRSLFVLGPGAMRAPDRHGRVPWFGLTARTVARVELTYRSAPPLRVTGVNGAFVLLVRPARGPREIVAFDAAGRVVGRKSIASAYPSGG